MFKIILFFFFKLNTNLILFMFWYKNLLYILKHQDLEKYLLCVNIYFKKYNKKTI